MLTAVKNQGKVTCLSIKYAIQRELLNKATFILDTVFMILNNASFLIQWLVLFQLKNSIGGYDFKQVALLWGLAAGTYGFSHFFFKDVYKLSDIIHTGKLDTYLIQPKEVLLSCITASVGVSALGDMLYAYIMLFVYGFSIKGLILITFLSITGGLIMTSMAVISASLSFWFGRVELLVDTMNSMMVHFASYPEGIFKGFIKVLFYTFIPLGFSVYLPVRLFDHFNISILLIIIGVTIFLIILAYILFYRGLKRYSSSNLMNVRV